MLNFTRRKYIYTLASETRSQCLIKESYFILEMDNMIYYEQLHTIHTHIAYL